VGGLKRQEPQMWFLHPRVFWHFLCPQALETYQGVSLDSLGVCTIKIGCIIAPDHRQRRQEAPKRILAMLAVFLCFPLGCLQRRGVWGCLNPSQVWPCGWGTLKDKKHPSGQKPPACSGTFCAPSVLKLPMESHWTPWGCAPSKSGA
jgi:hypothetical protein